MQFSYTAGPENDEDISTNTKQEVVAYGDICRTKMVLLTWIISYKWLSFFRQLALSS